VRVGSAPAGWEVPCISRPVRKKRIVPGMLASVSEDLVRDAMEGGQSFVDNVDDGEELGGRWVEDLNGLLGFNKRFKGRYVDGNHQEEE
jgi:hypothetical protein